MEEVRQVQLVDQLAVPDQLEDQVQQDLLEVQDQLEDQVQLAEQLVRQVLPVVLQKDLEASHNSD